MLKNVSKGDWEVNGKNIITKGGTFLGYAASKEDAKLFAAAKKLLSIVDEHLATNPKIRMEISKLFEE